jgi:hypothetical protein
MKELEALQCLEQFLQSIRPLAEKASDPFGPDIFYAEDIAQQVTPELIEQCSTALVVLRQVVSTRHKRVPVTSGQFTRDDVARMLVITLDQVLESLHAQQIVEGIAVLPAGEDVYLVDIVMRGLTTKRTWGISVTITPIKEQPEEAP